MPQKGVAEPRRGQDRAFTPPTPSEIPFAVTEFQGSVIGNFAESKTSTDYSLGIGASPTTDFTGGPWNPVDCDGSSTAYGRMKFGFAGGFMHFCTTTGPKVLESISDDPRAAGLQRMPDPVANMGTTADLGANGVGLPYLSSRAYRTVLRKPLSNGTSLLSPPSGRSVIINRILAPIGAMVRNANVVTVTIPSNPSVDIGLLGGSTFTVDPGEANFPNTSETVNSIITPNSFDYNDVGANASNTIAQDLDTGPRAVIVYAFLPEDATEETPVRIYRSLDTTTDSPNDEMYLVAEIFPTAGDITNGAVLYIDVVPESALVDPLYTNPLTGEGAGQANFAPPLYRDTTNWGERQWYSNTTGLQQFHLQMLGVGGPDGVQNNDTITIDGVTFTFKTAAAAPGDIQIVSNGLPSVNVQGTSLNLISAINDPIVSPTLELRAYYESTQNGASGKILLEAASHEQTAFGVTASRPATWTPALDASTAVDSVAERIPNGFSYSKLGQPEAVPPVNYGFVGAKNYAIARIIGLKQALIVFKEGDGIYSLTGSGPFQAMQISTANIIAPDACVQFADNAWVYTDQGILRVSDGGGATVVSRPIETVLNEYRLLLPEDTHDYAFAVAYETERRVMFFVPTNYEVTDGPDRPILQAFCYNNATQAWTGPLYTDVFSGVVGPEANKLFLGVYDAPWATGRITEERKDGDFTDYADADFANTIAEVAVGGDPLVIRLGNSSDVEAGDGVAQNGASSKIRRMRPDLGSARIVEVYEEVDWTVAACHIWKHYDMTVQFQPQGNPTARKALTRLAWLFKPEQFANLGGLTILATDQLQANAEIETTYEGYGLNPYGITPYGDPSPLVVDVNPLPAAWTNAAQFFLGFRLSEVWAKFRLQGFSLQLETATGPTGRGK